MSSTFMWRCTSQRCAHPFLTVQKGGVLPDFTPNCPKCRSAAVETGARKVPGMLSAKTKGSDSALRGLSNRYGLSDMGQRGGTRTGETAMQIQQRSLENNQSVCAPTKDGQRHRVQMPAGFAKFKASSKRIPTQVVAAHKG